MHGIETGKVYVDSLSPDAYVIYVEASSRVFGFKTLNFVGIFTLDLSIVTTILLVLTFLQ